MKKTDHGLPQLAALLASKGRGGDTMLAHINPQEAALLKSAGGSGTINPETGLPEFIKIGPIDTGKLYDATVGQVVGPNSITGAALQTVRENITGPAAQFVGDVAQKVGQTVDAIMSDPKKLGAVAVMIAFPEAAQYIGNSLLPAEASAALGATGTKIVGQAAINTALNGGDVQAGIKSALISQGAPVAAQELAKYITPDNASTIDRAFAKYGSQMATQAGAAALMGKDPAAALLFAGANAAADIAINSALKEINPDLAKSFKEMPLPAQNAVAAGLAAKLTGQDLSSALGANFVSEAINAARNAFSIQKKAMDTNKVGLTESQFKSLNPAILGSNPFMADMAGDTLSKLIKYSQDNKIPLDPGTLAYVSTPFGFYDASQGKYIYDPERAASTYDAAVRNLEYSAEQYARSAGFKSAADQYDANQAGINNGQDWYNRPAGIQVASTDSSIPKVGFTGSPIYAESPDAKTVRAPFGYDLMPASMAENKPDGAYYDETQNAWLIPNDAVQKLQDAIETKDKSNITYPTGNVINNPDGSYKITGDDGSTITFGANGNIIGHTPATDVSSVAGQGTDLGKVEVTAAKPSDTTTDFGKVDVTATRPPAETIPDMGTVEVTDTRPPSETVTDLGNVDVTDTRPDTPSVPTTPTNPPVTPPPVNPPPVNPPVKVPTTITPEVAAGIATVIAAANSQDSTPSTPVQSGDWVWNWNQQPVSPVENAVAMGQEFFRPTFTKAAEGGLLSLASGGTSSSLGAYSDGGRLLRGPGDGMSDNIPAMIGRKQPARLADGEFVVPADVVSHLGNGSTDAGAKVLYDMMDKVRRARTGNAKQGKQINPKKFMPK